MAVCTFFGHRDCYSLDTERLQITLEDFIHQGVDTYYVGNQGQFDSIVYQCLKSLQISYPHIRIAIVLAYLPTDNGRYSNPADTMYPEIEGHPKFAIERRNRWMVNHSDRCLCYINHTWGGAYKFSCMAKRHGLTVINLGNAKL